MEELIPDSEPLADWELQLLAEEDEERRRRDQGGDEAGDREPLRHGPYAGSGAAALPEPDIEAPNAEDH